MEADESIFIRQGPNIKKPCMTLEPGENLISAAPYWGHLTPICKCAVKKKIHFNFYPDKILY